MTEPKTISIHIKDKDGVFLLALVIEHTSGKSLLQAFTRAYPLLTLGPSVTTVEQNHLNIEIGGVKIQKGVIPDANIERHKYLENTGN